ncbi:MAG TPA: hypothetical protein VFW20_03430 [Candidatus Limnocylindrales bacterium]|nr:hypothetical protein [Candidatus Limnocylindrales bacterium]
MTPSEFAFLALGLLLGIATGGAIVVVFNSHPPTHEIKVTVARDAIPRRASTLAADAVPGGPAGPAPGGPGDRRGVDRESSPDGSPDRTIVRPARPIVAAPTLPWLLTPEPQIPVEPALIPSPAPAVLTAIAIQPEPDPILVALDLAGPQTAASGGPAAERRGSTADRRPSLLAGLLAGSSAEQARLVDAVAGEDPDQRAAWEVLVARFVGAVRQRSLDLGFVNVALGNPFWDTFTLGQCRQIVTALASTGRRFDGRAGWADAMVPTYRDLTRAAAESGIDPLRIRAWPNSDEIAELFRGASIAAGEAVADAAPGLDPEELQAFLGERNRDLDELWQVWDVVRAALLAETFAPA